MTFLIKAITCPQMLKSNNNVYKIKFQNVIQHP